MSSINDPAPDPTVADIEIVDGMPIEQAKRCLMSAFSQASTASKTYLVGLARTLAADDMQVPLPAG